MNPMPVYLSLLIALGLVVAGCSSEDSEGKEHVWKDQVETIDKAREVEGMILDAAKQQKKDAEDATY